MICEHCGAEMVKEVRCCGGRDCSCHGELIEVEVDDCPNPNCFLDGMLGDGGPSGYFDLNKVRAQKALDGKLFC